MAMGSIHEFQAVCFLLYNHDLGFKHTKKCRDLSLYITCISLCFEIRLAIMSFA